MPSLLYNSAAPLSVARTSHLHLTHLLSQLGCTPLYSTVNATVHSMRVGGHMRVAARGAQFSNSRAGVHSSTIETTLYGMQETHECAHPRMLGRRTELLLSSPPPVISLLMRAMLSHGAARGAGDVGYVDVESLRAIASHCSKDQLAAIQDETLWVWAWLAWGRGGGAPRWRGVGCVDKGRGGGRAVQQVVPFAPRRPPRCTPPGRLLWLVATVDRAAHRSGH